MGLDVDDVITWENGNSVIITHISQLNSGQYLLKFKYIASPPFNKEKEPDFFDFEHSWYGVSIEDGFLWKYYTITKPKVLEWD